MDPTAQCVRTESMPHRAAQPALSAHSCAAGERPGGAQRARQSSCRWAMSARGGWRRQHAESAAEEAVHSTPRRPARPARSAHSCADGQRPAGAQRVDNLAAGGDAAEARLPAAARRHAPRWGRAAGDGAREGQRQPEHVDAPRKRRAPFSAANASSSSSWPRAGRRTRSASTARSRPSDETSQLRLSLSRAGLHQNVHRSPEAGGMRACVQTAHGPCGVRRLAASSARLVERGRTESTGSRRPKVSIAGEEARRGNKSWHAVRGGGERMARAKEALSSARRGRGRADRAGEGAVHGTPRAGSGVGSRSSLSRLLILASLVYKWWTAI